MSLLQELKSQFIVPVIRQTDADALENTSRALADGGLRILEITLMSDAAYEVIRKLSKESKLTVGAGTVLTGDQARRAIDAGSNFLITPGLNIDVIHAARSANVVVFPGVLTPSEIMQAHREGCDVFKIFPISAMGGASYLKSLQGPFPNFKWMPTGGISIENIREYRAAGALAVGMGGKLIPQDAVDSKSWSQLTKIAADHVRIANSGN